MKIYQIKRIIAILLLSILFITNNIKAQKNSLNRDSLLYDIDILFGTIKDIHLNIFANISDTTFEKELNKIKSSITNDTDFFDFFLYANSLVTKLNDGHTNMILLDKYFIERNILVFPLSITINNSDSSVIVTKKLVINENTIPCNSKIININNIPTKQIIEKMIQQISGETIDFKIAILKDYFSRFLFAIYKHQDFDIKYLFEGKIYSTHLKGILLKETQLKIEQSNIKPFLLKIDTLKNIAIIDFNRFKGLKNFDRFLDSSFSVIKNKDINNLIIDLRGNFGGNPALGDALFQYISKVPFQQNGKFSIKISDRYKEVQKQYYRKKCLMKNGVFYYSQGKLNRLKRNKLRYTGDVYVLQDYGTYSAASNFTWTFKYFNMGKIIGTETGGLAVSFTDITVFELPYTKIKCGVSYKKAYNYNATDKDMHGTIPDYYVPSEKALDFTINLISNNYKIKN